MAAKGSDLRSGGFCPLCLGTGSSVEGINGFYALDVDQVCFGRGRRGRGDGKSGSESIFGRFAVGFWRCWAQ